MNFEYLRAILLCASLSFSCYDTVISTGTSIFECLETDIASGLKLVSQMVGKTNFLSRSTLSSQSFPLSSDDVRFGTPVSSVDSPCFTNWSCLCFESDGRFLGVFSPPPAHQSTPAGLCHVVIYISPESELPGILIEYAPWSLTFYTANSLGLGLHLVSTIASIPQMIISYTDLRKNDILNWLFLHSSFRVNFRSSSIFTQARCFSS